MQGGSSQRRAGNGRPAVPAARFDPGFEPLLAVGRGKAIESVHRGAIAVVDVEGGLLGGLGDPSAHVLLRSSAKPFQAAAVVESGAAQAFSLGEEEIAIMAASHVGTPQHVVVVERLLGRAGVSPGALVCGSIEHNCSGKHAGMLLLALHLGAIPEGYQNPEHPVQQEVERYLTSLLADCPGGDQAASRALFAGIDGCGVPVVRTTLYQAAWLYAALAAGTTPALARVRDAMLAYPTLVAGEARFDTRLMKAAPGRVVAKGGAEGVQGVGMVPGRGTPLPAGLGCAIKVEDGSPRPIPPVVTEFLRAWDMGEVAVAVEGDFSSLLLDGTGAEVGRLTVLAEPANLRRRAARPAPGGPGEHQGTSAPAAAGGGGLESPSERAPGLHLFGKKDGHVTVCRGDERDILRFLRDQWPAVDEENFGRKVEWSAEPQALVYRRDKRIVAVLKGHFIGGIASVDELMVGDGHRGSGLGSLLLGRLEDEARRRRCMWIVLRAVKDSPAEDFYLGRGYHRECVQYGYEFGYDYVRLVCDVEQARGEAGGSAGQDKGAR